MRYNDNTLSSQCFPQANTILHSTSFSKNIQISKRAKPTLNSSLSADGRRQTHGTGHKVGEDLVGTRRLLVGVFAEIGDLQGRVFGRAKGAFEGRRLGGISNTSLLLAGGDGDSGSGRQLLASANAQQGVRSGGESHCGLETSN